MSKDTHADQDLGNGQGVELDEIDPSNEVILEGEDQIRSQSSHLLHVQHALPPTLLEQNLAQRHLCSDTSSESRLIVDEIIE